MTGKLIANFVRIFKIKDIQVQISIFKHPSNLPFYIETVWLLLRDSCKFVYRNVYTPFTNAIYIY